MNKDSNADNEKNQEQASRIRLPVQEKLETSVLAWKVGEQQENNKCLKWAAER